MRLALTAPLGPLSPRSPSSARGTSHNARSVRARRIVDPLMTGKVPAGLPGLPTARLGLKALETPEALPPAT